MATHRGAAPSVLFQSLVLKTTRAIIALAQPRGGAASLSLSAVGGLVRSDMGAVLVVASRQLGDAKNHKGDERAGQHQRGEANH